MELRGELNSALYDLFVNWLGFAWVDVLLTLLASCYEEEGRFYSTVEPARGEFVRILCNLAGWRVERVHDG